MLLCIHTDYLNNKEIHFNAEFILSTTRCDIATKWLHEFTAGVNHQISIDSLLDAG